MSNWINRTLASTMLAAALTGVAAPEAEAQNYREQQAARNQELITNCYTVGQQKGVAPLPLTNKAFQQDRNLGVGCTFASAAGGEYIVEKAFDLTTPQGASSYANTINNLQKREDSAQQRLLGNRGRVDQNGNPISNGANEARKTVDSANGMLNSVTRGAQTVDRTIKSFEKLFERKPNR